MSSALRLPQALDQREAVPSGFGVAVRASYPQSLPSLKFAHARMSCYWERLVVSTDGHFDGTEEGIRILAGWRVAILLQQPPSFSETLHAVLEKILRH